MLSINSLPCIYLHIKYDNITNSYSYLEVNDYYSKLFHLDNNLFTDKNVGFLDSLELSLYSDIHLLIYLNTLAKKEDYQTTIDLIVKQNNVTKTINDSISLLLFGKVIDTDEFIVIGYTNTNQSTTTFEPTSDRILNNLPIYIYWKDFNGKYLGSNNSLAPYLVVDEPAFTSLVIDNTNTISYYKYCDNLILNTKSPLTNIIETHLIAPEGKKIHVRANKIPIIIKGFILAILYTYEDITNFVEQLNTLKETKELLVLKEQQYQELLSKVSNNTSTDINTLFHNLSQDNLNSEKELLQLESLLNRIEDQVKTLFDKVYTADNSIVNEITVLKQNQLEDFKNFTDTKQQLSKLDTEINTIKNSISFMLFFKNLTSKQLLLFFLVLSVLFTFIGNKLNQVFIKNIIDKVEKVI